MTDTIQAQWCQPMDCGKHTPRAYLIKFDDAEMGDLVFTDEAEARDMFHKLNDNWNCYLMASLPLSPPAHIDAQAVTIIEQRDEIVRCCDKFQAQRDAQDAKIKALVEALEELVTCVDDGCYCSEMKMASAIDTANETIVTAKETT